MKVWRTQKWAWIILTVLIVTAFLSAILFAYGNRISIGPTGPQPFSTGTVATYPYNFTGDPSGWTVDEAVVKVASYSGAEYIIIQDVHGDHTGAMLLPPEQLKEIVAKNNCKQIEVDGAIRYIILPGDIADIPLD